MLLVGIFLSAYGGRRSVCEDLAEWLDCLNYRVITTSDKPARLPRLLDMTWKTWSHRNDYRVAQIDVYSGSAFVWAEAVCQMLQWLDKPYILTLRGGNLPVFARSWPWRVRRLLTSANQVTTPSLFLQDRLSPFRDDILYLPNGINLTHYHFHLRSKPAPRLIWLRAFHSIYNPTMAVRALALLVPDFPDITLTMIGPDKGDGSWQAVVDLAQQLGVTEHIQMIPGVPKQDVPLRLADGDIFLNTTNAESFGVAVVEAASTGLCIVTTNVGELSYLWSDGHNALLVPPDNAKSMAAAVSRLLTEPGLAERLSHNARQKAEQFDWSVILPQWEQLLTTAVHMKTMSKQRTPGSSI